MSASLRHLRLAVGIAALSALALAGCSSNTPPLEQAAAVVTRATAHPAIASLRLERENLDELMYMNLHSEDALGAKRRRPCTRYAHMSGMCSYEP